MESDCFASDREQRPKGSRRLSIGHPCVHTDVGRGHGQLNAHRAALPSQPSFCSDTYTIAEEIAELVRSVLPSLLDQARHRKMLRVRTRCASPTCRAEAAPSHPEEVHAPSENFSSTRGRTEAFLAWVRNTEAWGGGRGTRGHDHVPAP